MPNDTAHIALPTLYDTSARLTDDQLPDWAKNRTIRSATCWIWTGPRNQRYGGQGGDRAIGRHGTNVARLIWIESAGAIADGLIVRHSCDNPMCVRPSHLLLGTPHANSQDAVLRGRLRPGGRPARAERQAFTKRGTTVQPHHDLECAHEPCHEPSLPGVPVPLCAHHLRKVYEFAHDLAETALGH